MRHQFRKHYSREEARSLLPQIRGWLAQLAHHRDRLAKLERRLAPLLASGHDVGGATTNELLRCLAQFRTLLNEFHQREIQVKDLDRGLIDFPALIGGREVFLCWEQDEDDIEFWHELDTGYAGRERL
jgi:hypothetical protein